MNFDFVCVCTCSRFGTSCNSVLSPVPLNSQADYNNHAIRRIVLPSSTVTTLAGLQGFSGTVDGVGTVARLNNPIGVALAFTEAFALVVREGSLALALVLYVRISTPPFPTMLARLTLGTMPSDASTCLLAQ